MRLRASKRSRPWYGEPSSEMRACVSIMESCGRSCRLPMAKSLGSCAGVTLTAPVPNSGLAQSSARMGIWRSAGKGKLKLLPDEMAVAVIGGVYGDGGVAEHGFRTGGRDGDAAGSVGEIVAHMVDGAQAFFGFDFEVGDGGLELRVPVDDVGSAIDEALLVEADEGFLDGDGEAVVHGEVFAGPVDGGTEAAHLVGNGSAILLLPGPGALGEGFAADGLAARTLGG